MSTFPNALSAAWILVTTSPYENQRRKLVLKLRAMEKLPKGWSFGEGLPVSPFATQLGATMVMIVCDAGLEADVFPNLDGGCAIAAYGDGDGKVEVSVRPTGQLDLKVEQGFGCDIEEVSAVPHADLTQIVNQIDMLPRSPWKSSGFLTCVSTNALANASGMSCMETPASQKGLILLTAAGGFQSSTQNAPAPN
jgi:hypothetical protein